MKKFAGISVLLVAAAMPSFAQSMLKVSLSDRTRITVSVDGRHFRNAGESVTVNDLPKGKHYVMVYLADNGNNGHRPGVIWEGKIKTYLGQVSNCVINPFSREATISEQDMYGQPMDGERYSNHNLNNYDTKPQPDNYNTAPGNTDPYAGNTQMQQPNTQDNSDEVAPLPDGAPVASPVSGYDEDELLKSSKTGKTAKATAKTNTKVDAIKAKINAKATDTDKLEAAKASMKKSSVKTADVVALMDCFNFESTKVEFAKWAYTYTSDKANYKQIKQKLTMKQYREEMDTFLKNN